MTSIPSVDQEAIDRSPLARRLVVVIDRTGTGADRALADALARTNAVSRVVSSGVFTEGVPWLIGNHVVSEGAGLGTLLPLEPFLAATRALLDDLLGGDRLDGLVVERCAPEVDAEVVRIVYPDATVVEIDDRAATDILRNATGAARTVIDRALHHLGHHRPGPQPAASDDLRDRLILVFGVPRSGTTWLEELLLAASTTTGVPAGETWMFDGIQGFWRNLESGAGLHTAVDRAGLAAALRRFCDRLLLDRMRRDGDASYFVEKTPGNAWLLPYITAVYPDAWCVHIVRDGRDVSRSIAEMDHGDPDLRSAAAHWAETLLEVDRRAPDVGRLREVRYESLLRDPVAGAIELLAWVGVPINGADEDAIRRAAGVRVSRHGTSGPVGVGKWTTMPPEDLRIVLATAGDVLVRRGYATADEVERARRQLRRPRGAIGEVRRRARLRSDRSRA